MSPPPFTPEQVLECARTIRSFLPELLPVDRVESMDRQLASLLAQAKAGETVGASILEELKSHPATRDWAAEFLSPQIMTKGPGDSQLPGRIDTIAAPRYVCPEGDYVWYRRSVGMAIPSCPTHPELGPLVPAD